MRGLGEWEEREGAGERGGGGGGVVIEKV